MEIDRLSPHLYKVGVSGIDELLCTFRIALTFHLPSRQKRFLAEVRHLAHCFHIFV